MPLILAIDTATNGCSAALVADGRVLAAELDRMARGQSEALAPMMERVVAASGRSLLDVAAVAATRGPGAFTGLRIGLAAARGLALALSIPCIGVSTFDALHAAARRRPEAAGKAILIAIDSKRADLYVRLYGADGTACGDGAALPPAELPAFAATAGPALVIAGDGASAARDAFGGAPDILAGIEVPDAADVGRLGETLLGNAAAHPPTPLYLRPPDVTLPAGRTDVSGT